MKVKSGSMKNFPDFSIGKKQGIGVFWRILNIFMFGKEGEKL